MDNTKSSATIKDGTSKIFPSHGRARRPRQRALKVKG